MKLLILMLVFIGSFFTDTRVFQQDTLKSDSAINKSSIRESDTLVNNSITGLDSVSQLSEKKPDSTSHSDLTVLKEDPSAKKFLRDCSPCHTIGMGKLKGPDLIESIKWNDNELKTAIKKMEKEVGPLPDETIDGLVLFFKDPQLNLRISAEEKRQLQEKRSSLAPPDANIGESLFWGERNFTNNGLSCNGCHMVNGAGGILGPNLTDAYERIGEVALLSAIEKSGYRVMEPHYRDKPITPQESVHLTEYFKEVAKNQPRSEISIYSISIIAAFCLTFGLAFVYRKRSGK